VEDNMKLDVGTKSLETERLYLRKYELEDYKKMYKNWGSDPEVTKYVGWEVHKNEEATKKLIQTWIEDYKNLLRFNWIVIEKETGEPIGSIDAVGVSKNHSRAEIGYCYGSKWWGKGYATEALKAVISFLQNEIEIELVTAMHLISNPASGKVMKKAGMQFTGTLPKWMKNKEGNREDLDHYSILK
jgi:ribosomal-protein-alanine N-acetyltransferase